MSGSSRDESSHEDFEALHGVFSRVWVEELLSLMSVMVESYMESDPDFFRRLPLQRPGSCPVL
ncbi:hypothetical protein ACOSQ3_031096 [Xanthoceras sorbifolium]